MSEPTLTDTEREALADEVYRRLDPEGYGWAAGDGPESEIIIDAILASDWLAARVAEAVDRERAIHRDLVSRLGFGDNITEPMADNDTIVAWFEQQSRDASEWQETQLWRNDCYAMGHPQDDDCRECDPYFAVDRERAAWATKIEALAIRLGTFDCTEDDVPGGIDVPDDYEFGLHESAAAVRGLLAADDTEAKWEAGR